MKYVYIVLLALAVGPLSQVAAKGFDGANAPGGLQVGGKFNYPYQQPNGSGCCMDAEVEAISLGLDSDDPDTRNLAGEALKRNLQDQVDK